MATTPEIRWNIKAFEQIRRLPTVDTMLATSARRVADGCGDGYVSVEEEGKTRARAAVITATFDAILDNAYNNTLLANLDRGRV